MQKVLISLFIILSLLSKPKAQVIGFEINIADDSCDIIPTFFLNDYNINSYIGLVHKTQINTGYQNNFLYRINEYGDTISYSLEKQDSVANYYDLIQVNIGEQGYLLSGLGYNKNTPDEIFNIFTRLDTNLNILWEKKIKLEFAYSGWTMRMMQLKDSSFLFSCTPSTDMFLLHLSYLGDSLNFRNYTGDSSGIVQSITYNPDSSSIWLHTNWAHYNSGGAINSCIDIDGQLNQTKVYHYIDNGTPLPFISKLLPNGNLLTGGTTWISSPDKIKKYISGNIYDTAFNLLYEVLLTNPDTNSRGGDIVAIDYCDPSCIYLAGTHNLQSFTGSSPSWFYVAKLNDTLGVEFEKYIGGDYYYWLLSVLATKDGGVLLTGTRSELNRQLFHNSGYIIKLDSTGCMVNLQKKNKIPIKDAIVYPNPGNKQLNVRTALKNCTFYLYNIKGKQVQNNTLSNRITTFDTDDLKQGIYIYSIIQNGKVVDTGKWIKQ